MCQCGQNRSVVAARTATNVRSTSVHVPRVAAPPTIRYEYTGKTGLTVFGGATRRRYRFASSGAQVGVDPRDGASLDRVPNLRRVSSPTPSGAER